MKSTTILAFLVSSAALVAAGGSLEKVVAPQMDMQRRASQPARLAPEPTLHRRVTFHPSKLHRHSKPKHKGVKRSKRSRRKGKRANCKSSSGSGTSSSSSASGSSASSSTADTSSGSDSSSTSSTTGSDASDSGSTSSSSDSSTGSGTSGDSSSGSSSTGSDSTTSSSGSDTSSSSGSDSSSSSSSSSSSGSSSDTSTSISSLGITGFTGTNTGIGSWFRTDNSQDSTNGRSWCQLNYQDSWMGFAPSVGTMLNNFGNSIQKAGTAYCGLEAKATNPANGKTALIYIVDGFDDKWVKTPGSIDLTLAAFAALYGSDTSDKDIVIQNLQWEFTGNRNSNYAFNAGS